MHVEYLNINREVRRAALFNLTPSPITLPALLMRTLDIDPINRRATFAHVLNDIPIQGLSQSQREIAIARGLRDRIEGVKKAASRLVVKWAESSGGVIPVRFLFHFLFPCVLCSPAGQCADFVMGLFRHSVYQTL